MKNSFTSLVLLFLIPIFVKAQFKMLAEGKTFEEQTTGASKIVQLKNGNTFYIYLNTKINYKFYFDLYDRSHSKIYESNFSLKDPNLDFSIKSVCEMNGDLMLILSYYEKYSLILFRVLVDGNTGIVKESKQIADAGVPTPPAFGEEAFAGSAPGRVYIINNGINDGYSLVMLHNASEKNNIEVLQFDHNHKELKKSIFVTPDPSYKYMYLPDVTGIDKNNIALLCYPYNTRSSGGKSHLLILYTLNLENSETSIYRLPSTSEEIIASGIVRFNQASSQLLTLFVTEMKKNSRDYIAHISSLSISDKKFLYTKEISPTSALEKSTDLFSKKKSKINSPLNLLVNRNGSFSIVYEDIDYPYENATNFSAQYSANLGNIAVQQFDINGNEKGSYLVAKSQNINKTSISLHYQKRSEQNFIDLDNGKQYKYFRFFTNQNTNYILLNDSPDNSDNAEKGKITTVSGIGEAEAYYVNVSSGSSDIMPHRNNLFQKPNSLALFAISDYDEANNIFVTLRLVKGGKDNGVSLVWLQPQ